MTRAAGGLLPFMRVPRTIDERFAAFDAANPAVYRLFARLARGVRDRGWTSYSADALCHVVRWHYALRGPREGGFKMNDHFTSRLARKLIADDPSFAGFFELRRLRSRAGGPTDG
jgi:hypothetical protein